MVGVSVIICCHNSIQRLPKTLYYLSQQKFSTLVEWEVIVVDNASTDSTAESVHQFWHPADSIPLRTVSEPKIGLMYARQTGISAASFEIISFIDDDNWVCHDWVQKIAVLMDKHPEIGACGGENRAVADVELPWWFEKFQRSYAVGPQGEAAGDITWDSGVLFGAGLTIRKRAWDSLIANGFSPLLVGRQGTRLTCGEDYEICLALRLGGWKLWYEPALTLQHYLPSSRLQWSYLRRVLRVVGWSSPDLEPYSLATAKNLARRERLQKLRLYWILASLKSLKTLIALSPKLVMSRFKAREGDQGVLLAERARGRLLRLLSMGSQYDRTCRAIAHATWLTPRDGS